METGSSERGRVRILLSLPEVVSLDVAAGVLGPSLFVVHLVSSGPPSWPTQVALVCAVLAVYNLDHLLDSFRPDSESTARRRRYAENRRSLGAVGLLAFVVGAAMLPFLPRIVVLYGLALAAYQTLYFLALRLGMSGVAKRCAAAVGWAAGACIPGWISASPDQRGLVLTVFVLLANIAWINLQSYALVDDSVEGGGGSLPGTRLRAIAQATMVVGLATACGRFPGLAGSWFVFAILAVVQTILVKLPRDFVHPVGEWSLALLGLVRFLG